MSLHRTFILRNSGLIEAVCAFLRDNAGAMAKAGTPLCVTVTEHKSKRTLEQNARYWALLNDIAANSWIEGRQFSSEAFHEFFKRRFIGCEDTPGGGTVGISTRTLNVGDFADYMMKVEQYATDELAVTFA